MMLRNKKLEKFQNTYPWDFSLNHYWFSFFLYMLSNFLPKTAIWPERSLKFLTKLSACVPNPEN